MPQFPPKPDDVVDLDPMRGTPIPWDTKRVWALEGSQRDGELWCGTIPGRPVPLARRRRQLAARRKPVEAPGPQVLGRRRRRLSRHPLDPRRPAQPRRRSPRRLLRRPLAEHRRRQVVGLQRPRAARRLRAARSSVRAPRPGRASARAVRGRAGSHLDPASQRHLPQHRRRAHVHGDHERAAVGVRLPRRRASRRAPNRMVRARQERSVALPRRRRARRLAHARRRRELRGVARRLAAAARVRRRLSPRARHRCRGRYTRVRQHHGQSLRQRELRAKPGKTSATTCRRSIASVS